MIVVDGVERENFFRLKNNTNDMIHQVMLCTIVTVLPMSLKGDDVELAKEVT